MNESLLCRALPAALVIHAQEMGLAFGFADTVALVHYSFSSLGADALNAGNLFGGEFGVHFIKFI
jgi:hypothetical protein